VGYIHGKKEEHMFVLLNHLFITSWYISNVMIYILLELFRQCGRVSFSYYVITFVVVCNFVASIRCIMLLCIIVDKAS
jgi:hypothetical protein